MAVPYTSDEHIQQVRDGPHRVSGNVADLFLNDAQGGQHGRAGVGIVKALLVDPRYGDGAQHDYRLVLPNI